MECCALSLVTETLKYTDYIKCKVNTSKKKLQEFEANDLRETAGNTSLKLVCLVFNTQVQLINVTRDHAKRTRLFGARAAAGFSTEGRVADCGWKNTKKRSNHPVQNTNKVWLQIV